MHKINEYSGCICLMLIVNELVECIQWMQQVSAFSEWILWNACKACIVSISNTSCRVNIISLKIKLILYVASVRSLLSFSFVYPTSVAICKASWFLEQALAVESE